MSPTQLSLRALRADGWLVDVVEHWVAATRRRRDLFGFVDLLAVREGMTLAVQTTSATNASHRLTKITTEHADDLARVKGAGWVVVVHGWRKTDATGRGCRHVDRCGCKWTLHRLLHA